MYKQAEMSVKKKGGGGFVLVNSIQIYKISEVIPEQGES